MSKRIFALSIILAIILPLSFFGCKGRVENTSGIEDAAMAPQAIDTLVTTEPAQTIATEAIPPTAAPQIATDLSPIKSDISLRNKDIQTALKNAGFYTGSIDGKIGPKTKSAITEFQKARALKVDGKVGPKTWAELEKYLVQQ